MLRNHRHPPLTSTSPSTARSTPSRASGTEPRPAPSLDEITRPDAPIDDDLEALDNGTARLLTPEDDDWPSGLLASLDNRAPLALWVRGSVSLAELTTSAVTVTGSHDASGYGNTVAADFGYELARAGVTVISSGGYGVDEAAHRGTLAADGRTIVVLANGVDRPHPHQHARLFGAVVDQGGLLVSEYPIGKPPTRTRIHARCRLLATLGAATVIVEAGLRCGALAVARAAEELGRRVYGVPGPIYSTTAKGVNELLRTGVATVASSVEQINYQEVR